MRRLAVLCLPAGLTACRAETVAPTTVTLPTLPVPSTTAQPTTVVTTVETTASGSDGYEG